MHQSGPEDPVLEAAPLGREAAAKYCKVLPHSGLHCDWYHGFWLYMRALGLAKASGGQAEFFAAHLSDAARTGDHPRVLITGSVDYSMASHAIWSYAQERASQDLTVIDVCETPLYLSRWYGERHGVRVNTGVSDVLDYSPAAPFDVAMTNSFLGFFTPQQRPQLFTSWARVLRPGGRLMFTNRLRPKAAPGSLNRFGPEETEAFCRTVEREGGNLPPALAKDLEWMVAAARAYGERFISYPTGTSDEIVSMLTDAGFRIEHLDLFHQGGRSGQQVSGPTSNQSADYARVVAVRL